MEVERLRALSGRIGLKLAETFGRKATYYPPGGAGIEIRALVFPESEDISPTGRGGIPLRSIRVLIPRQDALSFDDVPAPGARIVLGDIAYVVRSAVGDAEDLPTSVMWELVCERIAAPGADLDADR